VRGRPQRACTRVPLALTPGTFAVESTVHLVLRLRGGMFHSTSGRVDNLATRLEELVPQIDVEVTAPGGAVYTLRVDTLAPAAALEPLLRRAMAEAAEEAAAVALVATKERELADAKAQLAARKRARRA
jgi:hypothetical protein